jgi:protein O-mannosyl-transferase
MSEYRDKISPCEDAFNQIKVIPPPMKQDRNKLYVISICAALALATIIAYEPVRHNGFINYDDPKYITENPNVNRGITRQSITWAFTKVHSANWHPLTWVSHILDCQLFGLNPFWHHLVSLLFHIANALLLFWILTNITDAIWPSAFVAAVFALHPVHVESVAWAAERKDVLSSLFWMLTMLAYIRYAERPNLRRYSLVLLAFVMGLMAKPMLVTLPFVLLLLDYWPLGRKLSIPNLLLEKVPLFVLSALSCVITLIAQHSGGAIVPLKSVSRESESLGSQIANIFVSYIKYIGKTIWPSRLAVYYPRTHLGLSETTAVICVLLFILISFGVYVGRRKKYITTGWLWYVGTLVPVIGLVQVGSQAMANRYMYIPMIGLLIIAAWAAKDLIANRPRWEIVAAVLATAALSSLLILTRMQVKHWQDSLTLFGYTLEVTENNAVAENNYGWALSEAGRLDEAMLRFTNAARLRPAFADAQGNMCNVLLKQGKLDEAIVCLNELIGRNMGTAEAHYNLGVALGMQKKYDDAIKSLAMALQLDAEYPNAHRKMGEMLLATGKPNEAIEHFNEALRMNKGQVKVYANLGKAYAQLGRYEPAIQNWTKVAELEPNNAEVLNNLAWLLATTGDVSSQDADRAVKSAKRACESTGYKDPEFVDTLAAAYASAGRFSEAIETAEKAIKLAEAAGQKELAETIQNRLEQYKASRPYHER